MNTVNLKTTIHAANELGECVLWDDRKGLALWTDILAKRLYWHDPTANSTGFVEFAEELCAFAFVADSDDLLCAFRSGFALVDREGGSRRWLHRIDHTDVVRLNDGRVDRQGRFWCGSMMDTEDHRPIGEVSGELLRVDADGTVSKHLHGIGISNSLCWSPDSSTMYFADTPQKEICAFDFDSKSGELSGRRVFARTPDEAGPDGSTVDADGFLWNAEWGQGRVVRYAPDSTVDLVVQLPVSHVSCVAFGGHELSDLYVTTARAGLSQEQLAAEPQAGDVFVFTTAYRGLAENRFRSG